MGHDEMMGHDDALVFKKIEDKFIALDIHGKLTTWDMQTGKIRKVHHLEKGSDFTQLEVYDPKVKDDMMDRESDIYRKGHFDYVLLVNKKPNDGDLRMQDLNFYGKERL